MRKTVLWILGIAGGLTGLILLAVAIAVATVDPKTLVGPVQSRLKAGIGRDLSIAGSIELKLSLEPKLIASDVTLSNAPWARAAQMAHAKRVEVQVALLPLLQKRFEVVEVALIEPTIALESDAQGRANWDFGGSAGANATPTPTSASPASAAGAIAVGNVVIRDGTLTYRDDATGRTTNVTIERLAVRSRANGAPIDAEFKGTIDDVAVAVTGNLGPLDALRERRWPYPVAIKGDIAGKQANISTKIGVAGDTTSLDALDFAWGTLALKGSVRAVRAEGRTRYEFDLSSPSLSLKETAMAGGAAVGAKAPQKSATASRYVISDTPLPLDALKTTDLDGSLAIGELAVDERNRLRTVKVSVRNVRGKLDIPSLTALAYGGALSGRLSIDTTAPTPAVQLRLDGNDLDLGALLAAIGETRQVRGGKTAVALDVKARGASLHDWAASANGQLLVTVGPATLVNTKIDVDDVLDKLTSAVNPYRTKDPSTDLVCAVVRLPLADGVAHIDRSVAMETRKIGVSASGTLDFRNETVDFALTPRIREGIPIDIPTMAELVHFTGPLTHPAVRIDAVRSAATIARIGAAISTGGLSVLGTTLIDQAAHGDPCQVALGREAAASKPAANQQPASAAAVGNDIGKALGKLFGK